MFQKCDGAQKPCREISARGYPAPTGWEGSSTASQTGTSLSQGRKVAGSTQRLHALWHGCLAHSCSLCFAALPEQPSQLPGTWQGNGNQAAVTHSSPCAVHQLSQHSSLYPAGTCFSPLASSRGRDLALGPRCWVRVEASSRHSHQRCLHTAPERDAWCWLGPRAGGSR